MLSVSPKKILINVLESHPEGLTLVSLADISGLHRHTATKYVNELILSGLVSQRTVGMAKLCYLTEKTDSISAEKEPLARPEGTIERGRIGLKVLVLVAVLSFLLSETAILAYQNTSLLNVSNISNITSINTSPMTASNYPNNSPNETSFLNISNDEIVNSNQNGSSTEKNESEGNLSVEILNQILEEINETMQNTANNTDSLNTTENETLEQNNTGENETIFIIENETPSETPQNEGSEPVFKDLKLSLEYPESVTRGELVLVKATVFNADVIPANNLSLTWTIPAGFELVSGEQIGLCEVLEPDVSCVKELTLKTDVSTVLGTSKIRVVVDYE